jgi:hypothetical protein
MSTVGRSRSQNRSLRRESEFVDGEERGVKRSGSRAAEDVQAAERLQKKTQSNSKFVHVLRLIGGYCGLDPTNERLSRKWSSKKGG